MSAADNSISLSAWTRAAVLPLVNRDALDHRTPDAARVVMTKRIRRHHTPEQKAALVRRHLAEKVPVSDICNEH
jgi:hypothetical protein